MNITNTMNNLFIDNFNNIYLFLALSFGYLVILKICNLLFSTNNRITDSEIYDYLEDNIWDNSFEKIIRKIVLPMKGDYVILQNGRWDNQVGKITRYNDYDDTYNIKITKKLNPDNNNIPKRIITRERDDFIVNKY